MNERIYRHKSNSLVASVCGCRLGGEAVVFFPGIDDMRSAVSASAVQLCSK